MTEEKLECLIYLLLAEVVSLSSGYVTPAEILSVKDFEGLERVSAAFVVDAADGNWVDLRFLDGGHFRLRVECLAGGTKNEG